MVLASVSGDYLYNQYVLETIRFFLIVVLPALAIALFVRFILRRRRDKD